MLRTDFHNSNHQSLATHLNLATKANSSSGTSKIDDFDTHGILTNETPLAKRICRSSVAAPLNHTADYPSPNRQQLGGKGMFLQRMQEAGLPVPPFTCVAAPVVNTLEQYPLDIHYVAPYLPDIVSELLPKTSLKDIKDYLNALPTADQGKRDNCLVGLSQFIASDDFYQQVKQSDAARHIRDLRCQLGVLSPSQPVIVRSSGVNEDTYGDAQAGKYLSEVQGDDDVVRTCLKVMASGYRPEVCPQGIPQPMALVIQHCIDCRYGGVAMSFQSLQDDTIRVEYTTGQPRGVVGGQSGIIPHRINIERKEGADHPTYFQGTVSSRFILHRNKNNNGYSETEIHDAQSDGDGQRLGDGLVAEIRQAITTLENLLLCPVDVEFAINHQNQLFLLQVRPVTRLSGGMDFAMPTPEDTLASGEGASEGYCSGTLWLAKNPTTDIMPQGAIVVARHGEEWMLEPERLERAAGFVFAAGGTNDHVAITLRQAEKPCLLAGGQYPAVAALDGQQATLACARFNGTPGAFIISGDLTGKLASHRSPSSALADVPLTEVVASRDDLFPPEGTFHQVATAFHWLSDQNARLLAFFAPGGGLDCLSTPVKLSMSAQRSKMLAATQASINQLVQGAETLLDGYRAFLLLAGTDSSPHVRSLLDELPQLITGFGMLQKTIRSGLDSIILPFHAGEELPVSPGGFREWMAACQKLQACLQALHPREAQQVRSVHDLIFALHQRFVNALAPVTLASGQGSVSTEKNITYVNCVPPDEEGLLTMSCLTSIREFTCKVTVVSMVDASIVNLNLGHHVGIIELLEHAEGGKERTLRLKFSDRFKRADGSDQPGKLKRMWFLVQLLKAIELNKEANGINVSINAAAGEIVVECTRMISRQAMQNAFTKLTTVLSSLTNLDLFIENRSLFEGNQWNFNLLAQRIRSDLSSEAASFAFKQQLLNNAYKYPSDKVRFYDLLSRNHRQLITYMKTINHKSRSLLDLREILMSDEIGEGTRRELLHHLLFLDADIATQLFEHVYGHLRNQYFVIKPSHSYSPEFYIQPGQPLPDNKEKVKAVLLKHGLAFASQRVRSDKDVVLPRIVAEGSDLQYVNGALKSDKDVVMAAVTQTGFALEYASPELWDDLEVVMTALATYPRGLRYASERIRSDKSVVQTVIADDIDNLCYASKVLLNDRVYMLSLIEQNPRAYISVGIELEHDVAFIKSAIHRNPAVLEYVPNELRKVTI